MGCINDGSGWIGKPGLEKPGFVGDLEQQAHALAWS